MVNTALALMMEQVVMGYFVERGDEMRNQIEFKVYGRYALFSDPLTRVGGEKFTYRIPTYQALVGICESIYWKPTFFWVIDSVRVMNPIKMQSKGIRPLVYGGSPENTLSYYTYLADVEYEVRAHFMWNLNREDLQQDRNENKHHNVAKRMVEKGGRRDIFLGTRECQAYVEPVVYGKKESYYQKEFEVNFGLGYHSFVYPSESGIDELHALFDAPIMREGEIIFEVDHTKLVSRFIKKMDNEVLMTSGLNEFDGGGEQV